MLPPPPPPPWPLTDDAHVPPGRASTVYHNKLGLRAHIKPQSFLAKSRPLPRQALPTRRADLEYYRDPARRGYLVPTAATDASSEVD